MENHRVEKFLKDPKKALYSLTWPIVIGMLVQSLYNIVDTIFVGRLGAEAIAAITFSFPLFFLLHALGSGVGIGMSSRISRMLGAKDEKEAENTAIHGIYMTMAVAGLVFILGLVSMNWIFSLFGATPSVSVLAKEYFQIILIGVFFMFPVFLIHNIFVSQGDTKTPVYIQVIALTINIILDPIFIFVLGYGVKGAAIATTITFFIAMLIGVVLLRKKSILKIRLHKFKYSYKTMMDIIKVGFPASIMIIIMSVYVIFINRFMAHFGTNYVASFGIVTKLEMLAIMPIMSFSLAVMTLVDQDMLNNHNNHLDLFLYNHYS